MAKRYRVSLARTVVQVFEDVYCAENEDDALRMATDDSEHHPWENVETVMNEAPVVEEDK